MDPAGLAGRLGRVAVASTGHSASSLAGVLAATEPLVRVRQGPVGRPVGALRNSAIRVVSRPVEWPVISRVFLLKLFFRRILGISIPAKGCTRRPELELTIRAVQGAVEPLGWRKAPHRHRRGCRPPFGSHAARPAGRGSRCRAHSAKQAFRASRPAKRPACRQLTRRSAE